MCITKYVGIYSWVISKIEVQNKTACRNVVNLSNCETGNASAGRGRGRKSRWSQVFHYGVINWDGQQKKIRISGEMVILILDMLNLRCWQSVHMLQLET